jgi:alkylation response protein AidB-like acyl-CoA dehydrogenase
VNADMNFDLSDEQYALQEVALRLLGGAYPLTRLNQIVDEAQGMDREGWQKLAKLGYVGLGVPETYGGIGLKLLDRAVVSECIGYTGAPGHFVTHVMATEALVRAGSPAQKAEWLPGLAAGERIATVAFAEEGGGWQPEEWRLTEDDGRIYGSKRYVLHAQEADLFVVGLSGGRLALVSSNMPGLTVEPVDGIDRTRPLAWVHFDGTPYDLLPDGVTAAGRVRDAGLVLLAADAFGGATRAIEITVDYVNTRVQFGRQIGSFQSVKHQIAEVGTLVETGRGLYWYAAHAFDNEPEVSPRVAALAKALLADRFDIACRRMVELHGGIGFTWEYHVQVWFKRAIFDRYFLGQPSVHRERAARLAGW